MPRDPRFEPREGDSILAGPQWQQEVYMVIGCDGKRVRYRFSLERPILSCTLAEWRTWMLGGEVIYAA